MDTKLLKDNRSIAENKLAKLRFNPNPELYFEYSVLEDYLQKGIIELVKKTEVKESTTFYLPHKGIIRKDRVSSKSRIVSDASSRDLDLPSLINCLFAGPNLYPEIFNTLLLFRLKPKAFTADMKQAFLQIKIEKGDVSRFSFAGDPFDEFKTPLTYRFTRVLFGLTSSPFLLAATIKHHLKKYLAQFPETVDFMDKNIYVDGVIGSCNTVQEAFSISLQSIENLQKASFKLHKWHTNSSVICGKKKV